MKKTVSILAVFAVFLTILVVEVMANGDTIVIIVNRDNPVKSLSIAEVRKFYENDVLEWPDGTAVVLYDLPIKDDARKVFSDNVLGKDAGEVAMEWASKKITNTAKNPPLTLKSPVLIQDRVGKNSAAMGYILKSKVSSGKVKVVGTIN